MGKIFTKKINFTSLLIAVTLMSLIIFSYTESDDSKINIMNKESLKAKTKKARSEYFFNILRDPATNSIPKNIRARELKFASQLNKNKSPLSKTDEVTFEWREAGPNDVGGRTRALAVDRTNSNIIIAGGASGGIWKSTDNGESWHLKSKNTQQLSVTYVTQDPAPGNENIWYYTSGEVDGTVADNTSLFDNEGRKITTATFTGSGLYKSTDSGENWDLIQSAGVDGVADTYYDYMSKIDISPVTGSIFISSNLYGIIRSTDGGQTFNLVLGDQKDDHSYVEFDVASDGKILATLSDGQNFNPKYSPGVFISIDDGLTWIQADEATGIQRSVIDFAPSNSNIAYVWFDAGGTNFFYKYDFINNTRDNYTDNLPDFGGQVGNLDTQGSYNMILAVKPDDENFVILGGTNLFRSFDGFATAANNELVNWIGGYDIANNIDKYQNHHPDQHSLFFDPSDPNKLWSGHDGGLSYVLNINESAQRVQWINKNNGYNVTQFYHLSMRLLDGSAEIVGGTQDNGSPIFEFTDQGTSASQDVSSGDGSFSHFSENLLFFSSQEADITMVLLENTDIGASLKPAGLQQALFSHPFAVDPNNENNMYIPDGNSLWRNTIVSTLRGDGTSQGWSNLGEVFSDGVNSYTITALTVSTTPADILYLGLTNTEGSPKVIKLANASSPTTEFQEVSPANAPAGAYLTNISVNPTDANEFIVVFGNYNVSSLFYTNNGGQTYSEIEGNLAGDQTNPGPSIRDAEILHVENDVVYLLATSTGVYSAETLSGSNTVWQQEAVNVMGNVPAVYLTSVGPVIAAATHGRGIFVGAPSDPTSVENEVALPNNYELSQNYPNPFNPSTKISFSIPKSSNVSLKVFNNIGEQVAVLKNEVMNAGTHHVNFDGSRLASGVYYYRIEAGEFVSTKKMMLLK